MSRLSEQRRRQFCAGVGLEGSGRLRLSIVEHDRGFLQDVRGGLRHAGRSHGRSGGSLILVLHQERQVHVSSRPYLFGEHLIKLFRRAIRLEK